MCICCLNPNKADWLPSNCQETSLPCFYFRPVSSLTSRAHQTIENCGKQQIPHQTTFRSCLNLKKIYINNILNWIYCLFQSWWWKHQRSETSCSCWELHKCIWRIGQLARIWCWHGVQWQILLHIFYFSLSFNSILTERDGEGWKIYLHNNIHKRSVHKCVHPGVMFPSQLIGC